MECVFLCVYYCVLCVHVSPPGRGGERGGRTWSVCFYVCIIVLCVHVSPPGRGGERGGHGVCDSVCVYSCVCVSMYLHQGEEVRAQEDVEFQRLEKELSQEEEKENHTQTLLREIAECQRSTVTRKVQSPVHVLVAGTAMPV